MKLMSSIEAGVRGVVKEIAAQNAAAVEYGEVLMVIDPR
jgi:biotin carboxyl carrier protein